MTVRELIEPNQMITDIKISVRIDHKLLDQLCIGCHSGIKPPFPTRVPIDERYINNTGRLDRNISKDAAYIPESINAWDDGRDYWQVKVNKIPAKWLDLEVIGWDSHPAPTVTYLSERRNRNINFHGEAIRITALPSGEKLDIPEQPKQDEIDGQMSFEDWNIDVVKI